MESARRLLAAGYYEDKAFIQMAEAVAPAARLGELKPLFERIMQTPRPHPER